MFDNLNCKKILISPHHGDLYHKHFNPKYLKSTKTKNYILKLINILFNFFSFTQRSKLIEHFFFIIFEKCFKNYQSSPYFNKELWFLFFFCRLNNLFLKETFCFDYSMFIGSKPTYFICYTKADKDFYRDCFKVLNWQVEMRNIIEKEDFISLHKNKIYQIIFCAPQITCNKTAEKEMIKCLKLLLVNYKIKSFYNREHPFSDHSTLNFYKKFCNKLANKIDVKLTGSIDEKVEKIYITGPSTIISEILDEGPIVVVKEFPIQAHKQIRYYPGSYAIQNNSLEITT